MPQPRPFLAISTVLAMLPITVFRPTPPTVTPPPPQVASPAARTADARHTTPAGCPRPNGPRVPATGTALRAATSEYPAADHPHDLVFPAATLRALPDIVGTADGVDARYALARGAFAADGAVARVTVENVSSRLISVEDIRPVNIVTECVPHAAVLSYRGSGADPAPMMFDLADAEPRMWAIDDTGRATGPYFDEFPALLVEDGERQDLQFAFRADAGAYTFDLLLTYDIGGKRERTLLRNGPAGFRVTARPDAPQV
ncbi:hypothetical protein [Actinoplanes sp. NPDC049802]|uniref:hypothetical protein n=1 Tax=Actinoplanes sp. NPDC049802 TaxID=3154742 RepID=UPI0033E28F2E